MNKISLLAYRLKVRNELLKLPKEMIYITYQESKTAWERANRKKEK